MLAISAHDLVTGALVYLSIGSGVWLVLDGLGIIENSFVEHPAKSGRAMVIATLMMIAGWPVFIWCFFKGLRRHPR